MICPPQTSLTSYRKKKWVLPQLDPTQESQAADIANQLQVPVLIARILVSRGLTTPAAAATFLDPKFKDLHPPYLLPNMHPAADRIVQAIRANEKITLYGDYDVDGITGTTMLWHTLKTAGADVDYYIPHRVDEGYGLNPDAVRQLIESGTKLLITIDCGCSAIAPITLARQLGVDVIVSDHHEFPGDGQLPPANAIIHPRLPLSASVPPCLGASSPYPNPDLCGAGVAFKLAWAIAQKISGTEKVSDQYRALLMEFTALTALGTIADVVPLTGENRIIVRHGLVQLLRTQNPGLLALINAAGYGKDDNGKGKKIDCTTVGFALAPRLNAAGRMGHAREAVELLTTATPERAKEIAQYLESQNKDRQSKERKMLEVARAQIDNRKSKIENDDAVLVVSHESFHAGIVGIVASRIVDLYHRPTFVLAQSEIELHGSARSISGFELHLAIENARDLLTSGGGHAMAGCVNLSLATLDAFRDRLNAFAREKLTDDLLTPALTLDGILSLDDCKTDIIAHLEKLEPFGRANPTPRFLLQNVRLSAPPRRVGATGAHLQLTIARGNRVARCIAFKMGDLEPQLPVGTELHLVVEPKIDCFNGNTRVDLVVCDIARCDNEPLTSPHASPLAHQSTT